MFSWGLNMADITFLRGTSQNLNSLPLVDGQMIFVTDTGEWYTDEANESGVIERRGSNITDVATKLNEHMKVHAPSDAEKNTVVGITRNGQSLTISEQRVVDISVPELQDFIVVSKTKPTKECLWCQILRQETV